MAEIDIVRPTTSPLTQFRAGLAAGGIPVASDTRAALAFPPRLAVDGSLEPLDPARLSRSGTVVSATRITDRAGTRVLALVDLDGGGRLLARIRDDGPAEALIATPVALVEAVTGDEPALTFAPIDAGARP